MLRIRAGTVHPVTVPPIADGAVLVDDRGKLAAVGPAATVPAPDGARLLEFPDGAIVPGLVNCHTHLELTHLAGRNPERGFPRWIRTMRALKDATTPEEFSRSAEQGVRDGWARGITCIADTGSSGAVLPALSRLGAEASRTTRCSDRTPTRPTRASRSSRRRYRSSSRSSPRWRRWGF